MIPKNSAMNKRSYFHRNRMKTANPKMTLKKLHCIKQIWESNNKKELVKDSKDSKFQNNGLPKS